MRKLIKDVLGFAATFAFALAVLAFPYLLIPFVLYLALSLPE